MEYPIIRRLFSAFRHTPFHPQWFSCRHRADMLRRVGNIASGRILDIGCSNQEVRPYLGEKTSYIGLDYYQTATQWYGSRPQVFGDAHALPFPSGRLDCILLLDVLEHLPEPDRCMAEIRRVLKPEGLLIIQVPFIYPIHDKPLDYQRWTIFGLLRLLMNHDFILGEYTATGNPVETAALLSNIALSKIVLKSIERGHPMAIMAVFLPFLVVFINAAAWLISLASPEDDMMPFSYLMVCKKKA
jgi:SAM-dependent methyltransferase